MAAQESVEDELKGHGIPVVLPSGADYEVATVEDAEYIEALIAKYMAEFVFENPSDLADLDLIVQMESLCWRWNRELALGYDRRGEPVSPRQLQDFVKSNSTEIRRLKDQLGMDRKQRMRTAGDGSVAEFLERLRTAGAQMNILRCAQLDKALELCMQLRTLTTVYFNGDDELRRIYHCTAPDILEWIANVYDPEMQAVDDYFMTHEQSIWIRKM